MTTDHLNGEVELGLGATRETLIIRRETPLNEKESRSKTLHKTVDNAEQNTPSQ